MNRQLRTSRQGWRQWVESLEGRVLWSTTVSFGHPSSTSLSPSTQIVAGGQFANLNGKTDLLLPITIPVKGSFTDNDGSLVLLNKGNSTFSVTNGPAATGSKSILGGAPIAVGDFNGDHKQDFVYVIHNALGSVSAPMSVVTELGKGNGTFTTSKTTVVTGSDTKDEPFVTTGDFNHDGKLDIALFIGGGSDSHVFILYGNGDGTFKTQELSFNGPEFTSNTVQAIFNTDLNHDGKPDLVLYGSGRLATLLNTGVSKGEAQFKTVINDVLTHPAGTFDVQSADPMIGDFNGDKNPDLAIVESPNGNAANGVIQVFFGNGAGKFTAGPETLSRILPRAKPLSAISTATAKWTSPRPAACSLAKGMEPLTPQSQPTCRRRSRISLLILLLGRHQRRRRSRSGRHLHDAQYQDLCGSVHHVRRGAWQTECLKPGTTVNESQRRCQ